MLALSAMCSPDITNLWIADSRLRGRTTRPVSPKPTKTYPGVRARRPGSWEEPSGIPSPRYNYCLSPTAAGRDKQVRGAQLDAARALEEGAE